MRHAVDAERIVGPRSRRIALGCVVAFVLHLLWVPAHLAFETHLHHGVDPLAALAHGRGGAHAAHRHGPGEHGHDPIGERENDPRQPDGHEPHPASDHAADLLAVRSSVGPLVLAPLPRPCAAATLRLRASGQPRACVPHAPGGRPADPHATRGPPAA